MTRIETALARMLERADAEPLTYDPDDDSGWPTADSLHLRPPRFVDAPGMLATPTGQLLAAYLEAADTAVDAYGSDGEWDAMAVLAIARTTFRAATEPQP